MSVIWFLYLPFLSQDTEVESMQRQGGRNREWDGWGIEIDVLPYVDS